VARPTTWRCGPGKGIGASLLLVAVGAILAFAVNATVNGLDLVTVGWILMIVGAVGAWSSMIFWSSWGGLANGRRDATTIVERDRTVV
jgi:Domain of unknown function (DUF6458)